MEASIDEIIQDAIVADDISSDSISAGETLVVAGIKDVKVNNESVVKANVANITVPTKVSELENDSKFVDNTVNNLLHYYLKTETYSKAEINQIIGNINTFSVLIVDTLPTDNISPTTIYLIAKSDSADSDYYDEYMYINNAWEMIGHTKIDLSNYYNKEQIDQKFQNETIKSASESNIGGIRVWIDGDTLFISTSLYTNAVFSNNLKVNGAYAVTQTNGTISIE